jgi:hypothetical protein
MKHLKTNGFVGALLAMVATTAMAGDTKAKAEKALDQAKAAVTPGEVVLTGTEMKTLHDSKDPVAYRVCVKQEPTAGAVKVTTGINDMTLQPGDCGNVTGMHITATPETALSGAQRSIVTFDKRQ